MQSTRYFDYWHNSFNLYPLIFRSTILNIFFLLCIAWEGRCGITIFFRSYGQIHGFQIWILGIDTCLVKQNDTMNIMYGIEPSVCFKWVMITFQVLLSGLCAVVLEMWRCYRCCARDVANNVLDLQGRLPASAGAPADVVNRITKLEGENSSLRKSQFRTYCYLLNYFL